MISLNAPFAQYRADVKRPAAAYRVAMPRRAKPSDDRGRSLSQRLDVLTEGNERLGDALGAIVMRSKTPGSLRALAAIDSDRWRRLVGESGAAPTRVAGTTADERAGTYARRLARVVAIAFPTQALVARLKDDPPASVASAVRYLVAHPDFELGRTPLSFVAANPPKAGTAADVRTEVKSLQRIVEISPNAEAAAVLMKAGLTSAQMVADATRDDFVSAHPSEDCLTLAEMTYEKAQATLIADGD